MSVPDHGLETRFLLWKPGFFLSGQKPGFEARNRVLELRTTDGHSARAEGTPDREQAAAEEEEAQAPQHQEVQVVTRGTFDRSAEC
jgi:hypothetical protein